MFLNKEAGQKVFDDIAKVAGGAVNVMSGLSAEIKNEVRARVDELAHRLDLVPREDFEKLEAMLTEARKEQLELTKRVEALEGKKKKAPAKSMAKRKTTKSTTTKSKTKSKKS